MSNSDGADFDYVSLERIGLFQNYLRVGIKKPVPLLQPQQEQQMKQEKESTK
jgi:hypothetical protein